MSLLDQVNHDIADGMRARDLDRLRTLRMLKTALVNRRIEKGRDLDPPEEMQVVATLVKQRKEAIEQFGRAGRTDLANREADEIRILQTSPWRSWRAGRSMAGPSASSYGPGWAPEMKAAGTKPEATHHRLRS
jgi:hypothetical protein